MDTQVIKPPEPVFSNSSWEQYALRKAEEENREIKAKLEKALADIEAKNNRIVELEKEEIRKTMQIETRNKDDEGEGGLAGFTSPESLDKLAQLAGVIAPFFTGRGASAPATPVQQSLAGVDLHQQKRAVDYASFLAEVTPAEADEMHSLLNFLAYVFKNFDRTVIKQHLAQLNAQYNESGKQQAGQ